MSDEYSDKEKMALDALLKKPTETGHDFFKRSKKGSVPDTGNTGTSRVNASLPAVYPYTVPVFTVLLVAIWWLKPLLTGRLANVFSFEQAWPLLAYSLFTSLALAFLVANRFQRPTWHFYVSLIASLLVLFSSSLRTRFEVMLLLLLFLLVLTLLPFPSVQLQNVIGITALSALITFAVPVCITFLSYNYVDQDFLKNSWHLFYGSLFYFTPLFLPKAKGRLLSLFTGSALLIHAFYTTGFGLPAVATTILVLATFIFSCMRPQTYRYQPLVALCGLLLTVLFL